MPESFEPNLVHDHFRAILSQGFFGSWSGVVFRSVSPRYARPTDIVTGYGSYRAGGRWNAPGIYAIYGSIEPGLAADESFNFLLQHFGWQKRDIPPRMVVGIRVSLQAVLDLTNPASVLPRGKYYHGYFHSSRRSLSENCGNVAGRQSSESGKSTERL
jgi:hypothetical protein